jgi:phosphoketolase
MSGTRNRREGHKLERDIAKYFRDIGFPHVVTTRSESRSRDDQKIDLINKDEAVNGRLPYNVQLKNTTVRPAYPALLAEMPKVDGVINIVIHKQTQRNGDRFLPIGKYTILYLDDFMNMVKRLREYESKTAQKV